MSEFNRKNTHNFWHSPVILLVLFCILILFIYNIIGLNEKERETAQKKDFELANIETLRNREKSLSLDIENLKTEEGIEETIREKFPVVKENEKMVTIIDKDKNEAPIVEVNKNHGFWGWIKGMFNKK